MTYAEQMIDHTIKTNFSPSKEAFRKVALELARLGNMYNSELIDYVNSLFVDNGVIQSADWLDDEQVVFYRVQSWAADIRAVADSIEQLGLSSAKSFGAEL